MAPTIHCVRHAQGFHNLSASNHTMHDPLLTPLGEEQCRNLQKTFPNIDQVDAIVASPLKRTIYTALLSFEEVIKRKNLKIIALPELQETSDLPCDTGSSPEELLREFQGQPVNLDLVKPGWDSKRMKWAPMGKAIEKRAADARLWLRNRPETNIVVVTHGGFLHYFTKDWDDFNKVAGTGWANTEYRTYVFSDHPSSSAHIFEDPLSREHRKQHRSLDREERTNLERTVDADRVERDRKQALQVRQIQAKLRFERRDDLGSGLEAFL